MTPNELNTLKDLISKSVNNSHKIGINLDAFVKAVKTDLNNIKSQNETIINNQHILNSKLNELLDKITKK